jgi:uncharacterized membrane-anchored protein
MDAAKKLVVSKVPEVTILFWILKILATTLGETGGDAISMSLNLGYLIGSAIFLVAFIVAVVAQARARVFVPGLYWFTIIATTMLGTTMADFADRSLGIGYPGGVVILLAGLSASLLAWRWTIGTVDVNSVASPRAEAFYWITVLWSQTLGTALGDWMADSNGFGFGGGALVFLAALAALALAYLFTNWSRVALFWAAFVLTRPLGATVGDLLDKPIALGGLAVNRFEASFALLAIFVAIALLLPQRPGAHPAT